MHKITRQLINDKEKKILLIVLDGLGGLPFPLQTELETARTPNLNRLVKKSETGVHIPILNGITPGSGSAHLALFGYDPLEFNIGRGVIEALGLDIKITNKDLAIRGNFATTKKIRNKLIVSDRRAGRIDTESNKRIIKLLKRNIKKIDNVLVDFKSGIEHRFACKLSFNKKLSHDECLISDTDPQQVGISPLKARNLNKKSLHSSKIVQKLVDQISTVLVKEKKANYALLRGVSVFPQIPTFRTLYNLNACSITTYPMYKGISSLVGMVPAPSTTTSIASQVDTLKKAYSRYNFFYLHIKKTDSYGEDGDYKNKIKTIEDFDNNLPDIMDLDFDVICITGDHSTPSRMQSHSWHPVPVLVNSRNSFYGFSKRFTEKECLKGSLGIFEAKNLLNIILAHADMLNKFGA